MRLMDALLNLQSLLKMCLLQRNNHPCGKVRELQLQVDLQIKSSVKIQAHLVLSLTPNAKEIIKSYTLRENNLLFSKAIALPLSSIETWHKCISISK